MKNLVWVAVLMNSAFSQAQIREVGPNVVVAPKTRYSCEYRGKNGDFVMRKDVMAVNPTHAIRIAHVSELRLWPLRDNNGRWVLLSDLNVAIKGPGPGPDERWGYRSEVPAPKTSSTFADGVVVKCTPSSSPARQEIGPGIRIAPKQRYSCVYKSDNKDRPYYIMTKLVDGVDEGHAKAVARITELTPQDPNTSRSRWVLWSDKLDIFASNSFISGVDVSCQPSIPAGPSTTG